MITKYDIITIIFFIVFYIVGVHTGTRITKVNVEKLENVDTLNIDSLTKENVYKYIKENNIKHPDIVLAQSILETGNYKSNICKNYNNIFGFYNGYDFLKFKHWKESIIYYKKWQEKRYISGDYYNFLDKLPYAEDEDYIKKLKQIKT